MDYFHPLIDIAVTIALVVSYIFFGPHRLLFLLGRWYDDNFSRKARNELYHRVGVPCAGVITHRQFQKDGVVLFRYAYRPPKNPNMIYIREYIREPKHQAYPWDDDKTLVVLVIPGHCASGLEVRKLSEPAETYWRRISISSLVSLLFLVWMQNVEGIQILIPISFGFLFVLRCCCSPESDEIFEKLDVNKLLELEERQSMTLLEGDGEVSPSYVQDLSRRDILPSLKHAEAEIRSHLQLLRERNAGSFEQDLLKYYARCGTPSDNASSLFDAEEGTLIEATAVVAASSEDFTSSEEHGHLEMTSEITEQLPLLPAETGDIGAKK